MKSYGLSGLAIRFSECCCCRCVGMALVRYVFTLCGISMEGKWRETVVRLSGDMGIIEHVGILLDGRFRCSFLLLRLLLLLILFLLLLLLLRL